MPKSRKLSGPDVIRILERFGFEVIRVRGSHHIMRRVVPATNEDGEEVEEKQTLTIPSHGKQQLGPGLLKSIYRDACHYKTSGAN